MGDADDAERLGGAVSWDRLDLAQMLLGDL